MDSLFSVQGKTVVITGGAGVLGAAMSKSEVIPSLVIRSLVTTTRMIFHLQQHTMKALWVHRRTSMAGCPVIVTWHPSQGSRLPSLPWTPTSRLKYSNTDTEREGQYQTKCESRGVNLRALVLFQQCLIIMARHRHLHKILRRMVTMEWGSHHRPRDRLEGPITAVAWGVHPRTAKQEGDDHLIGMVGIHPSHPTAIVDHTDRQEVDTAAHQDHHLGQEMDTAVHQDHHLDQVHADMAVPILIGHEKFGSSLKSRTIKHLSRTLSTGIGTETPLLPFMHTV